MIKYLLSFTNKILILLVFFNSTGCKKDNLPIETTILSIDSAAKKGGPVAGYGQYAYVSWQLTESYSDVTIEALLGPFNTGTGKAWLTRMIGWNTAEGSELYSIIFKEPALGSSPTLVTLFSGINLSPGVYYLILGGSDDGTFGCAVWSNGDANSLVVGPGVTSNGTGVVNAGWGSPPYNKSYAPGSTFSNSLPLSVKITGSH